MDIPCILGKNNVSGSGYVKLNRVSKKKILLTLLTRFNLQSRLDP